METKPTLESLIVRYRREVLRQGGGHPELEIRLQSVDHAAFAAVYAALLAAQGAPGAPAGPRVGAPVLTQMVSVLMDAHQPPRGDGGRHPRPTRIREIHFEGGERRREQYVRKEPLLMPVRIPGSGHPYLVALSTERPDDQPFSSDESAIIRVKARASFPFVLEGTSELKRPLRWRVDVTVARQIAGSDADSALRQIVAQMFRTTPPMTAATLVEALGLADEARQQLYRYEVEVEFEGEAGAGAGAGPGDRDTVRPADVTAAASALLGLAHPGYAGEARLQDEVYRAARYVVRAADYLRQFQNELGLKRLLPQAQAITRADYRGLYPPRGLYLTDKADGKRALALVHDGAGRIAADVLLEYPPVPAPAPAPRTLKGPDPARGKPEAADPKYLSDTIVDGELVDASDGGVVFYGFDVIALAGEDLTRDGFGARLSRLGEAVALLRAAGLPAEAKPYVHLAADTPATLEVEIQAVHAAARPYAVDGLIFVEDGRPYDETATYKWKSARDNTIDFLARRAPASVLGKKPFLDAAGCKLHFLFVGIAPELREALGLQWCPGYSDLFGARGGRRDGEARYHPIQFAPSDAPLAYLYQHPAASPLGDIDGRVVEGRCGGGCLAAGGGAPLVAWEMARVRADRQRELATKRYYGNDFQTAVNIWLNYVDPFPVEQLWEGPGPDYFRRPKAGIYHAQTAVLSYVKTLRIAALKHADWVVDLGSGKGQDLGRYLDAEVRHLVAVDADRAALAELVRRRHGLARKARRGRPPAASDAGTGTYSRRPGHDARPRTATTVHVLVADATQPHQQTRDKLGVLGLPPGGADALVCNLAAHYFLADVEGMRNFVALARGTVKVGGAVVLTLLLGEAVHALFVGAGVGPGAAWDAREDGVVKYSLKRLYSSESLEAAGQRIGVLLPFSDGEYYEEYLVNVKVLVAEFCARGFRLVAKTNAKDAVPDFGARNRTLATQLTPDDLLYLSLYGEVVLKREK